MSLAPLFTALQFAAEKHRHQRRKDAEASPYVNHLIAVATVLVVDGGVTDEAVIVAALLHDTVEDTDTTLAELERDFGPDVGALVAEMTDDKALPKEERKRLQVLHAPHVSAKAKLLKLADKICNVRDVINTPPATWPHERLVGYLDWAEKVIAGCRGVNAALEDTFDREIRRGRERYSGQADG